MIMPKIVRTHISLFVTDMEASARWYEDIIGMEVTAVGEKWTMMGFGKKHHDIALIETDHDIPGGKELQHYGLEIEGDEEVLRRLYGMLIKKSVQVLKTIDHGIGRGIYFEDPDGHRLEFFLETEHNDEKAKQIFRDLKAPSNPLDMDPIFDK